MDRGEYTLRVFHRHLQPSAFEAEIRNKCILELGPGDALTTALLVAAHASESILVDVGAFACPDIELYKTLAAKLKSRGLALPDLGGVKSVDDLLRVCESRYLTEGLDSLRRIESNCIDVAFSHSVLQFVKRGELKSTLAELYRIMKLNGVCSHWLDLRDTLSGTLNNLRFPDWMWESRAFAASGYYTNRFRYSEWLEMLRTVGFEVRVLQKNVWSELPTPTGKMSS